MFFQGTGVEKDMDEAEMWFKKAADLGYRKAEEALSQIDKMR